MPKNLRSPNPFYNNDAVRDLSMLFGRQRELLMLYEAILKHQSLSIVGSRHIGKSSLLKYLGNSELQQDFASGLQKHIFILTDWREYLQKKREDFFQLVCEQIIRQCQPLLTLQPPILTGEDRFRKLLEDIKHSGFHPVLLMDAFDRVTSNPAFDPHFFSFLRSLAGVNDLISYVTATIKSLDKVCHSDTVARSPFFNIFLKCPLGPLTPEEARKLIELPAHRAQCAFTPEEVDWLLKQAGQHPFFLQVACRHLFEEKLHQEDRPVNLEQVQRTIAQELQPHFTQAWEDLEEEQKAIIKREVFQRKSIKHQHVELSGSLLFRRRVLEMSQDDLTELTPEEIREALDHLDDTEFLAQSKLGTLQCVSLQIDAGAATSTPASRRGVQVRELLKKAFEQMKPGGLRNDTATEWRLYNILWYHYFKYHLPNHNTAARLEISLRQFYREQDKAIQALLREILDIEARALHSLE
jgi:hypothetical protein